MAPKWVRAAPRYEALVTHLDLLPARDWSVSLDEVDRNKQGRARVVREGASALLVECSYTEVLPDLGRDLTGLVITDFDLVIRDTDLDGIPDEFQRRPLVISGVETLLDNGYLAIRDSDDHVQILELWDGVIGAATMELLKRTRGPDSRPTRRE